MRDAPMGMLKATLMANDIALKRGLNMGAGARRALARLPEIRPPSESASRQRSRALLREASKRIARAELKARKDRALAAARAYRDGTAAAAR